MYALFFVLILFFLLLFVMHLTKSKTSVVEPLTDSPTYQPYSGKDPMVLAQKNAANIQYLQGRLKELQGLEKNFNSLQDEVTKNKEAINNMSKIAVHHISQTTGVPSTAKTPPKSVQNLRSISNNSSNIVKPGFASSAGTSSAGTSSAGTSRIAKGTDTTLKTSSIPGASSAGGVFGSMGI